MHERSNYPRERALHTDHTMKPLVVFLCIHQEAVPFTLECKIFLVLWIKMCSLIPVEHCSTPVCTSQCIQIADCCLQMHRGLFVLNE